MTIPQQLTETVMLQDVFVFIFVTFFLPHTKEQVKQIQWDGNKHKTLSCLYQNQAARLNCGEV